MIDPPQERGSDHDCSLLWGMLEAWTRMSKSVVGSLPVAILMAQDSGLAAVGRVFLADVRSRFLHCDR